MNESTDSLLETLYSELRGIARNQLAEERPDHTLQATALVHEVAMKLGNFSDATDWESRSHFLRTAAEGMVREHAVVGGGYPKTCSVKSCVMN